MKRIAAYLLGMIVLSLLALAILMTPAQAQVTDNPITKPPSQWSGRVMNVDLSNAKGCMGGWVRPDRYRDWIAEYAFVDMSRLTDAQRTAVQAGISAEDIAGLVKLRTVNAYTDGKMDPALVPCRDKLRATLPPAPWVVAPYSTGKRPAYLLNADKTRGVQSGYADTTITLDGKTVPMWCKCTTRSVETTTSTYCSWATAKETVSTERVTLCREVK
jgi:hypothetical protein